MMKKKYYNNRLTMSKGSMNMKIIKVINDEDKKKITRAILEALPEWFGIVEAREEYILDSVGKDFFCAIEKDKVVGFLYLKQTGKDTIELAVMGVLKEYHRKGIERALFEYAKESIKEVDIRLSK